MFEGITTRWNEARQRTNPSSLNWSISYLNQSTRPPMAQNQNYVTRHPALNTERHDELLRLDRPSLSDYAEADPRITDVARNQKALSRRADAPFVDDTQ
jgi:hypothetical protein